MAFSEKDEVFTQCCVKKGLWGEKVYQEFTNKNWSLLSVKKFLTKTDQTGRLYCGSQTRQC